MLFLLPLSLIFSTAQCANILGVFMYPSIHHQNIYQEIWRELSLRGHQVTVVTPNPLNNPSLPNLTEISVRSVYEVLQKHDPEEIFLKDLSHSTMMEKFYDILDVVAEKELNNSEFRTLIWDDNKHFDLVLVEAIHPVMYALGHRFNAPVIAVSATNIFSVSYDAVGNPNHPVLYPEPLSDFAPLKATMLEKVRSIIFFLWIKNFYHNVFVPRAHRMAEKYFGDDLPYIGDLERNVSMFFINRNLLMDYPRPNVPSVVEMSPIDVKPAKALPKDLKKILDDSRNGVVYVNFENSLKYASKSKINEIFQALSEVPYTVLVKWAPNNVPVKASNIIARSSLPQRDLLAHSSIKALVTNGNPQSLEDAISNAVPVLCIPLVPLYAQNVRRVIDLELGEEIAPDYVTKTSLKYAIIRIATTETYKSNMDEARELLLDKPMSGLNTVVWWSEFVIRHKGAGHLRSPAVDMPYYQYLLLDVLSFLFACIVILLYVVYKICALVSSGCRRLICGDKKKEKAKQN